MLKQFVAAALAAALVTFVPVSSPAATSAPGTLIQQAGNEAIQSFRKASPEFDTFLGDYSHDGDFSDPTPAGLRQVGAIMTRLAARLDAIDMTHATLHDRNDMKLMRALIIGQRRGFAEVREGKNPAGPPMAVLGLVFTMILHKDEQEQSVWWDHMISRLEKAPAWMAVQKAMITHPGRLQAQIANQQLSMAPMLFSYILTPMASGLPPEKKARFDKASAATVAAFVAWTKWMSDNSATWPLNYAMGARAYNGMLKNEFLLPYNSDQIAAIGQKTLDDAVAQENAIQAEAKAKGVSLSDAVQAAANGGGMTPNTTKEAAFAFFQTQLDTLNNFVNEKQIVTIPPYMGKMVIRETPAFLLPIQPGAAMSAPPLLSKQKDGIYFVPPPKPDMAAKATAGAIFEDFDRDRVLMTSGHEGLPGHFLQLSIAKHNPDPIRRFSFDGVMAEGWAFYEEDLLMRMGLYGNDLDGRYAIAQFERLRGARAIVDTKLATGQWDFEKAVAWFQQNAGVDAVTARGEVSRHALGPGQAFDYAVGKVQIEDLLAKYKAKKGAGFNLKAFHDDLLSHGTVPYSIIASEMLAK
ncbi:MAG: hypothetical protein DLM50_05490 [Candidatus Meridianibacter frigidus]|nr:MAG: hypothetical protein DLM50_05490 [Candidatus Eremiobacteraeota bacterium]